MMFSKHIKSRLKILTLLAFILIFSMFIPSLQVYADSYNGGQLVNTPAGTGNIGACPENTAFFMYLVTSDAGVANSPGILVYNSSGGIAKDINNGNIKESNYLTKAGGGGLGKPLQLAEGIALLFPSDKVP